MSANCTVDSPAEAGVQDMEADKGYQAWLDKQWGLEADKKLIKTAPERRTFIQSLREAEAKRVQRMGKGSWQIAYKQSLATDSTKPLQAAQIQVNFP